MQHPLTIAAVEARQADLRETARLDRCCGRGAVRRALQRRRDARPA